MRLLALGLVSSLLAVLHAEPVRRDHVHLQEKRQECTSMPAGAGPTVTPDTPDAFTAYSAFAAAATAAPTPSGYSNTYTDLLAESAALGFMGSFLLQSYDSNACAAMCTAKQECMAFNIAFERGPSIDPGPDCPNPASTTLIKCILWAGPVTPGNAINTGQYREQFEVVVAGSNGYVNNTIEDATGYGKPRYLQDMAINAPLDCNGLNTLVGSEYWFDGKPFDAERCANICNAYGVSGCAFFNTFVIQYNSASAQACNIYNETWDGSYATSSSILFNGVSCPVSYSFSFPSLSVSGSCVGPTYASLGCYQDTWSRVLPYEPNTSGQAMTIQVCEAACANYTYFGLEYAQECYCGNVLPSTSADNCNMACQGNPAQACGGGLALNVYSAVAGTPTTSTTSSVVTTSPPTTTSSTIPVSTSVSPTTGSCQPTGLSYGIYCNPYYQYNQNSFINVSIWNPANSFGPTANYISPVETGTITQLNFYTPSGSDFNTVPYVFEGQTSSTNAAYVTMVAQGFFFAPKTQPAGYYTFSSGGVDNWIFVYTGETAYSAWNNSNYLYTATYFTSSSGQVYLQPGQVIPITMIWVNGGGPGANNFHITMPSGTYVSSNTTGYFGSCVVKGSQTFPSMEPPTGTMCPPAASSPHCC